MKGFTNLPVYGEKTESKVTEHKKDSTPSSSGITLSKRSRRSETASTVKAESEFTGSFTPAIPPEPFVVPKPLPKNEHPALHADEPRYDSRAAANLYSDVSSYVPDVPPAHVIHGTKRRSSTATWVIVIVFCLVNAAVLFAYYGKSSSASQQPKGLFTINDITCYRINLQGKEISDYFTLLPSTAGKVSVYKHSDSFRTVVVSYCAVEEGGWVGYASTQGKILYCPEGVSVENTRIACGEVLVRTDEEYLSIEEAQAYLPWLGK